MQTYIQRDRTFKRYRYELCREQYIGYEDSFVMSNAWAILDIFSTNSVKTMMYMNRALAERILLTLKTTNMHNTHVKSTHLEKSTQIYHSCRFIDSQQHYQRKITEISPSSVWKKKWNVKRKRMKWQTYTHTHLHTLMCDNIWNKRRRWMSILPEH